MPWSPPGTFERSGVFVVKTSVVAKRKAPAEFSHYEVIVGTRATTPPKDGETFITVDELIYATALRLEGSPRRIDLTWHPGFTANGAEAKVITTFGLHLAEQAS